MIKVFLVDDHVIVREGLKKVLNREPGIVVVAEAGTGREAVKKIRAMDVDVVILDISLPDMEGIEVLNRILKIKPDLAVLIYTMYEEDPLAIPYLKAGAKGYLTKGDPSKFLVDGIRKVADNKKYVTQKVGELLLNSWQESSETQPHVTLSSREFSVFRLIAAGKTVTEIAGELSIATATVSTYRKRILEKMNLPSNNAIMRYAMEHKIIQ